MQKETSFIIHQKFGHRIDGQTPQWMSDDFQRIVYNPSKDMVIHIPKVLPELQQYTLPKNMNDSDIQKNTKSQPMTLEEYFLVRYMLIELGMGDKTKYYIFHVKIGDTVFALHLRWLGEEWSSGAYSFGNGNGWTQGRVCVSLKQMLKP